MLFKGGLDSIIPHISDCSLVSMNALFLVTMATFLRLKLSRYTIVIAANIGQAFK